MSDLRGLGFNPTKHDTTQRSTLPDGVYRLEVSESVLEKTKAGDGQVLKNTISVIEPAEFAGRKFFQNINIENKSPKAQEIGQDELARLCRAIEFSDDLEQSSQICFKAFTAKVGLEKKQEGYEQKNQIKLYYYPDEGDPPAPKVAPVSERTATAAPTRAAAPTQRAAAAPPAEAGKKRPWG